MGRVSKKELSRLAYNCIDISNVTTVDIYDLIKTERGFNTVCYTVGTYGVTNAVVEGNNSGTRYVVYGRGSNLLLVL